MEFNKYENVKQFWKDTNELLEKNGWYNNLIIENCKDGIKQKNIDMFLATITNNNVVELIMLYRKPWKLIIYSPTSNYSNNILKFAAEEIYKYDKELLGINSEKNVAERFAKYYSDISNMSYTTHNEIRVLVLEDIVNGELLDNMTYRKVNMNDKEILIQYIQNFTKEALNEELDYSKAEEKFNEYIEKGYYVLEKNNKIVCQAIIRRSMKDGKSISSVYTPKEERNKGYAYNLIYRISKEVLDNGNKYCVLFTDDKNLISNHVYEKIGYKRKSDWKDIDFKK